MLYAVRTRSPVTSRAAVVYAHKNETIDVITLKNNSGAKWLRLYSVLSRLCSLRVVAKPPDRLRQKGSPLSTVLVGRRVHKLGLLRIRRHYFRGSSV